MKKIILTVAVALTVISCSKESVNSDCGCTEVIYKVGGGIIGEQIISEKIADVCNEEYRGYVIDVDFNNDSTFTHTKVICNK